MLNFLLEAVLMIPTTVLGSFLLDSHYLNLVMLTYGHNTAVDYQGTSLLLFYLSVKGLNVIHHMQKNEPGLYCIIALLTVQEGTIVCIQCTAEGMLARPRADC